MLNELLGGFVGGASAPSRNSPPPFDEWFVSAIVNKQWVDRQSKKSQQLIVKRPQSGILSTLTSLGLKIPYRCVDGNPEWSLSPFQMLNCEFRKSNAFAFANLLQYAGPG